MQKNTGFTLIELLVVVLIIGILSAVALPQYEKAVMKTRLSRLLPLMQSVAEAQRVYYMANGQYCPNLYDLDIDLPAGAVTQEAAKFVYPNFSCYLQGGGAPKSLYCVDLKYDWPRLERYFGDNHVYCWDGNSSRAADICKSLGGTPNNSGSLGTSYKF